MIYGPLNKYGYIIINTQVTLNLDRCDFNIDINTLILYYINEVSQQEKVVPLSCEAGQSASPFSSLEPSIEVEHAAI
jgi:hypothetical protein